MKSPQEYNATKPSQKRRSKMNNYHTPGVYLITIEVEGRMPLLGKLMCDAETANATHSEASGDGAYIAHSALGEAVKGEIFALPNRYREIAIWRFCIMPDHVHIIICVKEEMPEGMHLGRIVASLKAACSKAWWRLSAAEAADTTRKGNERSNKQGSNEQDSNEQDSNEQGSNEQSCNGQGSNEKGCNGQGSFVSPASAGDGSPIKKPSLFAPGYNDRIIHEDEQLDHWKHYLDDNPRRLWQKRNNRTFFTILRDWHLAGYKLQSVGNHQLLRKANKQVVRWHRYYKNQPEEWQRLREGWLQCAAQGGVLISPAIAPEEREVMNTAMERGQLVVMIKDNGFSEHYKPIGKNFDSCAAGTLLEVSPWEYRTEKRDMTKAYATYMNELAEELAKIAPRE